ncbi:MAG: GIY-YIG nuclease family protein [Patescibacteria group bacterium]
MENKIFYIYILTNKYNSVLYIGVTNNLERRMIEHKNGLIDGFSKKYNLRKLVYHENYSDSISAIKREKQLKNWHRSWKLNLIKQYNSTFADLSGNPETSSG